MSLLDAIPWGVCLLDGRRVLLRANARGTRLIESADGLTLCAERVCAAARRDQTALMRAVEQVHNGSANHVSLAVSRRTAPPLAISACRLQWPSSAVDARAVTLIIADPTSDVRLSEMTLVQLYGLTAAEARVAAMIAIGLAPSEIAAELEVQPNTVRVQLKAVYSKTGARRQSHLVRTLLLSPAALHAPTR